LNDELKRTIADELNVDPAELTSDKRLQDLESWDSVMVLVMMVILGNAAGKEILPDEMAELRTFGDIEALVARKQS
jgi:acyl carrier protein